VFNVGPTMMKREKLAIANIYVPVKRRSTLKPETVREIAQSMLEVGQTIPILASFGSRASMGISSAPNDVGRCLRFMKVSPSSAGAMTSNPRPDPIPSRRPRDRVVQKIKGERSLAARWMTEVGYRHLLRPDQLVSVKGGG